MDEEKSDFDKQYEKELIFQNRNEYLDNRKNLEERKYSNQQSYDKTILTISTLTLGFSLTLIKDNQGIMSAIPCILILSWLFLIISMLLILISFNTGAKAFENEIIYLDACYEKNEPPKWFKNTPNSLTIFLNVASLITLILGIILLLIFVTNNFNK